MRIIFFNLQQAPKKTHNKPNSQQNKHTPSGGFLCYCVNCHVWLLMAWGCVRACVSN